MKKINFKGVFKKCFGKEKNDRWHAVAMLTLYGIFFLIIYAMVAFGGRGTTDTKEPLKEEKKQDINYTYSYKINYDDLLEEILGKRIGNKEALVLTDSSNNISSYVVLNNTYYKLENDEQVKVDNITNYDKYFNRDKILELVKDLDYINKDNTYMYDVSNSSLADIFGDTLTSSNTSQIFIVKENDNVTSITLELDSYIKDLTGEEHSLKITLLYTNIGTTSDFEVLVD